MYRTIWSLTPIVLFGLFLFWFLGVDVNWAECYEGIQHPLSWVHSDWDLETGSMVLGRTIFWFVTVPITFLSGMWFVFFGCPIDDGKWVELPNLIKKLFE